MARLKEKVIEGLLMTAGMITILATLCIIWILFSGSYGFFKEVPIRDFLTDTQ